MGPEEKQSVLVLKLVPAQTLAVGAEMELVLMSVLLVEGVVFVFGG